jgi:hydroxymethylglutaryl-CoA lyase
MKQTIRLVECPRDAMQGWKTFIPTSTKVEYLSSLLKVGFDTIDCGSFVSAQAIPQMADTKEVLDQLDKYGPSKLLTIVANIRGAEEASAHEKVDVLGFPFSLSETFQQRNANSSVAEAFDRLKAIRDISAARGKALVAYLSMGFGNPYGDHYSKELVMEWAEKITALGVDIVSLADTVGTATPELVEELCISVIAVTGASKFGLHLHSTPDTWHAKVTAAYEAGCLRFDGAIMGVGGCPMAADDLTGNLDTLSLIGYFTSRNTLQSINHLLLRNCVQQAREIFSFDQ